MVYSLRWLAREAGFRFLVRRKATFAVVQELLAADRQRHSSPLDELTPREREVLAEMAQGRSNASIAESLVLTKRAVEKHVGAIFQKLCLEDDEVVSRRVTAVLMYVAAHDR